MREAHEMSVRELIALGTASQVPTRYRNHNGYFLRWDAEGFLFDPGEGTQRQMTYAHLTASSITRIFITHFHGDHCLGLAGLSQRLSLDRVPHPVYVHFPASGEVYFDRLRRASIYRQAAELVPCPIHDDGMVFEDENLVLSALRLDHGVDTFGYRLVERDRVTMLPEKLEQAGIRGRLIGELQRTGTIQIDGMLYRVADYSVPKFGQSVAFVMDTRMCDAAFRLAERVDLLVCESTYLESEAQEAKENGHLTASQAATIARDAGAKRLLLTHFSQRYPSTHPFVEEARAIFPNVVAAKDTRRYPIDRPTEPRTALSDDTPSLAIECSK